MLFHKAQGLRSLSLGPCREEATKLEAKVISLQEDNSTLEHKLARSSRVKVEALKLQLQEQEQSFIMQASLLENKVEDLQKEVNELTHQKLPSRKDGYAVKAQRRYLSR